MSKRGGRARAAVPRRVHTSAVALDYPDPPLDDGVVRLRPWSDTDLETVVEASRDPYIPKVTTVPAPFTKGAGTRWIERQRARRTSGTGLSETVSTDWVVPQGLQVLGHEFG